MVYAGLIAEPSVEEMGSLIAAVGKGAVSGLILLRLLPPKPTRTYKYPPMQVVNAFTLLYNDLKSSMDKEWVHMGLNPIVLEHSLCKLKRMKRLLKL